MHVAGVVVLCIGVSVAGLAGLELYARSIEGYLLWSWPLEKSLFFEPDRLKVWNRRFREKRPAFFRGWKIPLELFDADKPAPRYLFKPNLRMARHERTFTPARPGEEAVWSSNSWGFRGTGFSITKPAGVIRIVCLGASTTEGSQGDDETYPYFLQRELRRMFPHNKIEVINAGHHGHGVDDLLEILKQRVLPLHPDVVIWYEAANDAYPYEFVKHLKCRLGWPQGDCWLGAYPRWHRWLYQHSAIFVLLSDGLGWNHRKLSPLPHEFDDTPPKPSAVHYTEVLTEIGRQTLNHQSKFVLASFITLARAGGLDPNDDRLKPWYPLTAEELNRIYAYFNRESAAVARSLHVPYIDTAALYPKDQRYQPYDLYHFTPEGNQILAGFLARGLAHDVLPAIIGQQQHGEATNRNRPHVAPIRLPGCAYPSKC